VQNHAGDQKEKFPAATLGPGIRGHADLSKGNDEGLPHGTPKKIGNLLHDRNSLLNLRVHLKGIQPLPAALRDAPCGWHRLGLLFSLPRSLFLSGLIGISLGVWLLGGRGPFGGRRDEGAGGRGSFGALGPNRGSGIRSRKGGAEEVSSAVQHAAKFKPSIQLKQYFLNLWLYVSTSIDPGPHSFGKRNRLPALHASNDGLSEQTYIMPRHRE
jgi:hypothetical protein